MRKILGRKFWSLGTPLGSLGPLSQGDVIVGPYGLQILVIWGQYEPPVLVACQATAENPKSVGSWCAAYIQYTKEHPQGTLSHRIIHIKRLYFQFFNVFGGGEL